MRKTIVKPRAPGLRAHPGTWHHPALLCNELIEPIIREMEHSSSLTSVLRKVRAVLRPLHIPAPSKPFLEKRDKVICGFAFISIFLNIRLFFPIIHFLARVFPAGEWFLRSDNAQNILAKKILLRRGWGALAIEIKRRQAANA